jgi:hypothetical protein
VIIEREASNGVKLLGIVRSLRAEVIHLSNARSQERWERSEGREQDRAAWAERFTHPVVTLVPQLKKTLDLRHGITVH